MAGHSRSDSLASLQSAASIADLDLEAARQDTGVTAEAIEAHMAGPDEGGRWTCTYEHCGKTFGRKEPGTQMYVVSRSTRNHKAHARIIGVEQIVAPCHLVAKCGQEIDCRLTCANVLELAEKFYVNLYFSIATFSSQYLKLYSE